MYFTGVIFGIQADVVSLGKERQFGALSQRLVDLLNPVMLSLSTCGNKLVSFWRPPCLTLSEPFRNEL